MLGSPYFGKLTYIGFRLFTLGFWLAESFSLIHLENAALHETRAGSLASIHTLPILSAKVEFPSKKKSCQSPSLCLEGRVRAGEGHWEEPATRHAGSAFGAVGV